MTIRAKFSSVCPRCGERIEVGAYVDWNRGEKARHLVCQPKPQGPPKPRLTVEDAGVYVLPDGAICKVQVTKDKQRTYAKRWHEINAQRSLEAGGRVRGEWEFEGGLVDEVAAHGRKMTLDEAKVFIIRYGQCVRCARHLKAAESVERGIGPVCITYFTGSPFAEVAKASAPAAADRVEASDLGLPPGAWPLHLQYEGRDYGRQAIQTDAQGEVTGAEYRALGGSRLTVWND